MSAFDTLADGLNHLASALLDLVIPLLIAWALYLAQRYLPALPAGRAAEAAAEPPAEPRAPDQHHLPRTPITHPQAQPQGRAERRP